jgi:hypothetical protein
VAPIQFTVLEEQQGKRLASFLAGLPLQQDFLVDELRRK